jgi:hypothetical protein
VPDRVRIDIAFEGGISLAVNVPADVADRLDSALAGTEADRPATFAFDADDGRYSVVLSKVVFVKRSQRDQVVGFGAIEAASG